jgi:hypothetical protein
MIEKVKNWLAVASVLSLAWLALFGNLLTDNPSSLTVAVASVGWIAFSVLVFLRVVSFLGWIKSFGKGRDSAKL